MKERPKVESYLSFIMIYTTNVSYDKVHDMVGDSKMHQKPFFVVKILI